MAKLVAAVTGGVILGVLGAWLVLDGGRPGTPDDGPQVMRDIVDIPKMSVEVAEQHREQNFASLRTVEEIFALPTEFARAEALYVLAGRSDSGAVQNLIYEANRIADPVEREAALGILFPRLTELDPESALVMARSGFFAGNRSVELSVWRSWARMDLDAAIAAAKNQQGRTNSNFAAQALYAAFGYMGNPATDYIEEALGIGPDRSTRGRFLYRMADRSPAEAIAYINAMQPGSEQDEFVSWLANYLARNYPEQAGLYAEMFENPRFISSYEQIVDSNAARANPRDVLDRMLASGRSGLSRGELYGAMQSVAAEDLDIARGYFAELRGADDRRNMGRAIVLQMARENIDEALAWARANDSGEHNMFETTVLQFVAQSDPQRALAEAQSVGNSQTRRNLISNLMQSVSYRDPQKIMPMLEQIENDQLREMAGQEAIGHWLRNDPDGAVSWILTQDPKVASNYLQNAAWQIMRTDVDAAIRLLPLVGEEQTQSWRSQIAQRLAQSQSPDEAMAFIRQFETEPGFEQLRTSVIGGVAATDTFAARQMVEQLPAGTMRDVAYAQVIGAHAGVNPREAVAWLDRIGDERQRDVAVQSLVNNWYRSDQAGVEQWIAGLAPGAVRDNAIYGVSRHWDTADVEQEALIDSIQDAHKRGQARVRQIYLLMRSDPARARNVLDHPDIDERQREELEVRLSQMGLWR